MQTKDVRKILLINLAGLGDMLLAQPAMRALRQANPQAALWLLTTVKVNDLRDDFPFVDRWLSVNYEYGSLGAGEKLRLLPLLWKLRQERVDLAVNMRTLVSPQGARNMRLLMRIIAPRHSAGRNTNGWGTFYTHSIPETVQGVKHEMEYDIELMENLGARVCDRSIGFSLKHEHHVRVRDLLQREGIGSDEQLVGLHPGGMPSRRWSGERFSRLIDMLSQKYACRFVLTGSRSEAALCARIARQSRARVVSVAGLLSLRELGALIRRCSVFVSNDTGPMHIAAVLRTPLVALFGPGDMIRFDPRHIFPEARVIYHQADCAPCEKVVCQDSRCMNELTVEEVFAGITKIILH